MSHAATPVYTPAEDLRAYYAARAAEYDRVYDKPERQADLAAITAWLPPWFAGRRVLELACGTGWWTRHVAPVAAATVALDASEETLCIARQRLGDSATVHWQLGDAYAPPTDRGPFDACFAGFWYSHVPRLRRPGFLRGLAAVLEPGARLVMIDNRFVAGSSTPVGPPDAQGDTWQQRHLSDGSQHRVLKNFPGEDELRAELAVVARDIEVRHWPHYWGLGCRLG